MASIFTQGKEEDRMNVLNVALKTFSVGQFLYPAGQCVGKAHEAFCLHIIILSAIEKGYKVSIMTNKGCHKSSGKFLNLRGAASNFKTGTYDFFEIGSNNVYYEIHNNCYISGKSGAKHDADILIIKSSTGNLARNSPLVKTLSHADLLQAFECKNLDSNISLDIARSMKGLIDDNIANGNVHILSNYDLSVDAKLYFNMHIKDFPNSENTNTNSRFHGMLTKHLNLSSHLNKTGGTTMHFSPIINKPAAMSYCLLNPPSQPLTYVLNIKD